jgi:FixJ family two-component response regulator
VTAAVFVVDDDPSVRKSLTRVLTLTGYAVEAFASARDFLAREPFVGPCCLVLDVRMPGVTGLELQETLAGAGHRMPIVFITGHGDISMSVKAMKDGAVDFLTKPFDVENLIEAVQRALKKDIKELGEEGQTAEVLERVKLLTPRETEVFALGRARAPGRSCRRYRAEGRTTRWMTACASSWMRRRWSRPLKLSA